MNCPLRADDGDGREGWNQNPNLLDGSTRQDLNGLANTRVLRRTLSHELSLDTPDEEDAQVPRHRRNASSSAESVRVRGAVCDPVCDLVPDPVADPVPVPVPVSVSVPRSVFASLFPSSPSPSDARHVTRPACLGSVPAIWKAAVTFSKFVGPGFLISVAYIDPGNYSTDIAAGASLRFQLLFVVLWANIAAVVLQSLCIKLGTVTGMNLAELCRAEFPPWLNILLYIFAEVAIIATDIAEVIGTAIAINLLVPKIPLVAGCILSIVDVLLILLLYRPNGSMKGLRAFEFFVVALVLGVVICFCIQLSLIQDTSVGEVFLGYLPSSAAFKSPGLYEACGILGATIMPHSLYLGSGIVQPRLLEYDMDNGHVEPLSRVSSGYFSSSEKSIYRPSLPAIKHCLKYSIVELAISLSTFALFVNSAILIVSGSALSSNPDASNASLFSIYDLLSSSIAPAAGTIFALALLLSGISAGIICTIAGQMVSEGALNWTIAPWLRRLITRSISIVPSVIVAGAVGRDGLAATLNATQVVLSIILPFVTVPVIYFTCRNKYMTVKARPGVRPVLQDSGNEEHEEEREHGNDEHEEPEHGNSRTVQMEVLHSTSAYQEAGEPDIEGTKMRNHYITTAIAILVWLMIVVMNVANLVFLGLGQGG